MQRAHSGRQIEPLDVIETCMFHHFGQFVMVPTLVVMPAMAFCRPLASLFMKSNVAETLLILENAADALAPIPPDIGNCPRPKQSWRPTKAAH